MNYSYLTQVYAWTALAVERILSTRQFGAAAALVVALALGASLLAGSTAVVAQEGAQEVAAAPAVATVNINSADANTLAAGLNGVGQTRAMEIVRYREAYGPFASVEELTEVKGIGKSTLEKNRALITLE
jgi:competence protein ComEA